jgi:hypothetical protein
MFKPFTSISLSRTCAAILLLVAASATLHAQAKPLSIDLSGGIGIQSLGGYTGNNVQTGIDDAKHIQYGASAGVNIFKQLAVVGEFAYLPQGSQSPAAGLTLNASYKMAGIAVRYAPYTWRRYTPYLVGGGGYVSLNATLTSGSTSTPFNQNGDYISYGAGVSIPLYRHFGIRPEFRQDHQSYSMAAITGGTGSARQNVNRGMVSVFYQFGGRKAK